MSSGAGRLRLPIEKREAGEARVLAADRRGSWKMSEDHAVPLVRHPGRRGDELLRLDLQALEGHVRQPGPRARSCPCEFELEGQEFMALNAGPQFKFNEAISFFVGCETQAGDRRLLEQAHRGRRRSRAAAAG